MKLKRNINFMRNWLVISKLTCHEFDQFWPKHLKVSKIFPLMGSFWAKYILFELKKYRGVIFRETEEGYTIWGGIACHFKIDIYKEFYTFWQEQLEVSKIFTLMGFFWIKYRLFELKRYRGVIFMKLKRNIKF